EGLAEAQWRNANNILGDAFELDVKRQGMLTGKVLSPEGKPVGGATVTAGLSPLQRLPHLSSFKSVTNEEGRFTIRALPEYKFHLTVVDSSKRWVARPLEGILIA